MVFKYISSTDRVARRRRQCGATLVELMVAILLSTLVGLVVMTTIVHSARSYASLVNYIDLDQKSRNALDTMILDVREAVRVVTCTEDTLEVRSPEGDTISFVYDRAARTFTRVRGSDERVLLSECDDIKFGMYQRNPERGEIAQFVSTTDESICKVVEVNWVCSRQILGRTWNTESVQTAKIVLRNQRNRNLSL